MRGPVRAVSRNDLVRGRHGVYFLVLPRQARGLVCFHSEGDDTVKPLAFFLLLAGCFVSCASTKAVKDLNGGDPDNAARGNPLNTAKAREYLLSVLAEPEGREVKAYERRAYSPRTKKNLFVRHGFLCLPEKREGGTHARFYGDAQRLRA